MQLKMDAVYKELYFGNEDIKKSKLARSHYEEKARRISMMKEGGSSEIDRALWRLVNNERWVAVESPPPPHPRTLSLRLPFPLYLPFELKKTHSLPECADWNFCSQPISQLAMLCHILSTLRSTSLRKSQTIEKEKALFISSVRTPWKI